MGSIDRRNDYHRITHLLGVSSLSTHDAVDFQTSPFHLLERTDEIDADVLLDITAADGKHEDRIAVVCPAYLEPIGEDGFPPLIIGTRCEF